MIVCLSPNSIYLEENLNSINYGIKAAQIIQINPNILTKNWSKNRLGIAPDQFRDSEDRPALDFEVFSKRIENLEMENKILKTKRNL
jgi:hypothetical protein